ncbi:hypothetical protein HYV89_02370 [Candidatus Woesearchaeota archaeon]|nr:hypothetical protein [Candidatus Woesearchaeota archaeon]
MVKLEHIQDLHYHPTCKEILPLESHWTSYLKYQKIREKWIAVEKNIIEKYGCSLPAFLLYEHHFKDRSMSELAGELGKTRQSLWYITNILHLPVRDNNEKYTDSFKKKLRGKRLRNKPMPDASTLEKSILQHGVSKTSEFYDVSRQTIYDWRKKICAQRRY